MTDQAYEIKEKLANLEQALLSNHPEMPTLLRTIHRQLKADDDLVSILSEEEISILVRGLKVQTKTEIATKAVKSKPKKALKNITLDDL